MTFSNQWRKGVERIENYKSTSLVFIFNTNLEVSKIFAVTNFSLPWYQVICSMKYTILLEVMGIIFWNCQIVQWD